MAAPGRKSTQRRPTAAQTTPRGDLSEAVRSARPDRIANAIDGALRAEQLAVAEKNLIRAMDGLDETMGALRGLFQVFNDIVDGYVDGPTADSAQRLSDLEMATIAARRALLRDLQETWEALSAVRSKIAPEAATR